jgi:hypothetical protein
MPYHWAILACETCEMNAREPPAGVEPAKEVGSIRLPDGDVPIGFAKYESIGGDGGESNPHSRFARPMSSRWTTAPIHSARRGTRTLMLAYGAPGSRPGVSAIPPSVLEVPNHASNDAPEPPVGVEPTCRDEPALLVGTPAVLRDRSEEGCRLDRLQGE